MQIAYSIPGPICLLFLSKYPEYMLVAGRGVAGMNNTQDQELAQDTAITAY